ncbi:16S rRNA (uracil(1498)-N(3))-methyltransferase [Halalkalibacter sp. APA_J-10(15)]|uniref:16S rRNA (uracil(1498)-N(3))-methyltransferase n=1 Tax=unclassified Halalkalibacter TaxID=2893063 RepID=UPI001FF37803|nr:16S rRNA (uracil(1498)-N(3))-methyltransferase [Halalkalibacter sp. APA_J-10(15)]MCK0471601.1 16S rRNA (uracil(1498)-N(3))-methyltransferase [Halalkalibacter sp. APA_J-10(15)]
MQRYFVLPEQMKDNEVSITGEDVKHISKVMRMSIGDVIVCSNNASRTVRCTIKDMSDQQVIAVIDEAIQPNTELPIEVTIAQALPKADKLDWIIQKGTELGVHTFQPFAASRSIVKWDRKKAMKKRERLEKIAKEAAEQAYREKIPYVADFIPFTELLKMVQHYDRTVIAYEEVAKEQDHTYFANTLQELTKGQRLLIIIGPEGGLSEEEVEKLQEQEAVPCSFGPRILRTETAAMYALSAISYHFELMR